MVKIYLPIIVILRGSAILCAKTGIDRKLCNCKFIMVRYKKQIIYYDDTILFLIYMLDIVLINESHC